MISKRELMKSLKKNRFLVLVISVIIITGVYYGIEKAIDSYIFNTNSDIVEAVEAESDEGKEDGNGLIEDIAGATDSAKISEDEVDLELEGSEDSSGDSSNIEGAEEEGRLDSKDESLSSEEESDDVANALEKKIYVYITGEVNVPGVVILNKGSRIVDAINAAGGTTAKADVSKVNFVYVLEDGMKVNVPNSNDLKNNPDFEYITMSSGDGANDASTSGGLGVDSSSSNSSFGFSSSSASNYGVVNINTATQTELETLPGIGPSLALKIINYRKENGKFSSIEEIKNVSGIGDSKFESLKGFITI